MRCSVSTDPHELINLADKPEHAAKVKEMTALLAKEMASHADGFPLTVANPNPAEWQPPALGTGNQSTKSKRRNQKAKL